MFEKKKSNTELQKGTKPKLTTTANQQRISTLNNRRPNHEITASEKTFSQQTTVDFQFISKSSYTTPPDIAINAPPATQHIPGADRFKPSNITCKSVLLPANFPLSSKHPLIDPREIVKPPAWRPPFFTLRSN